MFLSNTTTVLNYSCPGDFGYCTSILQFRPLCCNEKYENHLQVYTHVHLVPGYRIFYGHPRKIFKPLKTKNMKKNMSSADRLIRLIISAILVTLYFTGTVGGTLGIILLVLSGVFTITSIISFCPLYTIFGISTCKVNK